MSDGAANGNGSQMKKSQWKVKYFSLVGSEFEVQRQAGEYIRRL